MSEIKPALLTRSEIDWLLGNKEVSKLYERKIRYSIKKKIETLTELEIPLLMHRGFNITSYSNAVTTGGNAARLEEHSLVGRGIANPEQQVNEVRESSKKQKRGEWEFRSTPQNFEPTCPFGHGISNPTPYQARRPPLGNTGFTLKHNINVADLVFLFKTSWLSWLPAATPVVLAATQPPLAADDDDMWPLFIKSGNSLL